MDADPVSGLRALEAAAQRSARRALGQRVLTRGVRLLPLPLIYGAAILTLLKARVVTETELGPWLACGIFVLCAWGAAAISPVFARRRRFSGAHLLDSHHQLQDRIASALEFARIDAAARTPFMSAAIADAVRLAPLLRPDEAVRFRLPRSAWASGYLILGLAVLALLEVRRERIFLPTPPVFQAESLLPDDLRLFRELSDELAVQAAGSEDAELALQFKHLLNDLSEQRLDRSQLLRRLSELEARILRGAAASRELREEGLRALSRELEKSSLTRAAAQALKEQRISDAERAFRELAQRLQDPSQRPDSAELERLRKALERAGAANAERRRNIEQRRSALAAEQQNLFRKKTRERSEGAERDQRESHRRQLERLERDKSQAEKAQRELSELDRQLAKAAEELAREAGASAEALEKSADQLQKLERDQLNEQQKKELLKRLQELRELLRRKGNADPKKLEQMRQFAQKARGGEEERGAPGSARGPGAARKLGLEQVNVPRAGGEPQAFGDERQGQTGKDEAPSSGQSQFGKGHDPNLRGEASELRGQTRDVMAPSIDTGQGTASAEVIAGAAERGFRTQAYKRIYKDYETVAERVLDKEEVPSGYRFYVRRYFQLIRPSE